MCVYICRKFDSLESAIAEAAAAAATAPSAPASSSSSSSASSSSLIAPGSAADHLLSLLLTGTGSAPAQAFFGGYFTLPNLARMRTETLATLAQMHGVLLQQQLLPCAQELVFRAAQLETLQMWPDARYACCLGLGSGQGGAGGGGGGGGALVGALKELGAALLTKAHEVALAVVAAQTRYAQFFAWVHACVLRYVPTNLRARGGGAGARVLARACMRMHGVACACTSARGDSNAKQADRQPSDRIFAL